MSSDQLDSAGFLLLSWSVFSYLAFLWLNSLSFGLDGVEFVVVSVLILCRTTVWRQPCSMAKAKLFPQLGRTLCPRQGHPFYRPDKTSVLAMTHWPRPCQKFTWHSRRVTQSQRRPIVACSAELKSHADLHIAAGSTDASLPRSGHDDR